MEVQELAISTLIPYARNARTHSDAQVAEIAASIREFGFNNPVLLRDDNTIIAGHGRVLAARKLGLDAVPCIYLSHLTETQARAYVLADNQLATHAGWEAEVLRLELDDLHGLGFDPALLGFAEADLADILGVNVEPTAVDAEPQIDKAEELRAKWGVETGQLWRLGEHRILCGDSTLADDVHSLMGEDLADEMLTDPPYGVSYVGGTADALTIENDDLDEGGLASLCAAAFGNAVEISRPGAYWYATAPPGPLHLIFASDWKGRGILRQIMVWVKDSLVLGHSEYHYQHEPILFGWVPGNRLKNTDRTRTTVWKYDRPKASREHPTMKPVALWVQAVKDGSAVGGIVYDPFCGSGTTIIACEQLGRKCRAIEISPAYVAVAIQRWADATGGTPELIDG